jgi:hypothetical protein
LASECGNSANISSSSYSNRAQFNLIGNKNLLSYYPIKT